ncbi:hypothetical protein SH611_20930 [Geminicoccaceae bacterium 1502E]|nr:hypothetical protein [Geminicoccaceae bacterium 1502E]
MREEDAVPQEADLDEPTLLHEPDLMLALLRGAEEGPVSLGETRGRLAAMRARAGLPPCRDTGELERRLEVAARMLEVAGALAPSHGQRFTLTPRGRELLREHPGGLDQTVLARFPEFLAWIETRSCPHGDDDPRPAAYTAGTRAFHTGKSLTDNPHSMDTADHLAWQNGWSEARDARARGE